MNNSKKIILLEILLSIFIVISLIYKLLNIYSLIILMLVFTLVLFLILGGRKLYLGDVHKLIPMVLISCIIFSLLKYIFAVTTGFYKSDQWDDPFNTIISILLSIVIVVLEEKSRDFVCNQATNNKLNIVVNYITFTLINLVTLMILHGLINAKKYNAYLFAFLIQSLAETVLLNYLTYKSNLLPSLTYKLYFLVLPSFITLVPNFTDFLTVSFSIIFAIILFIIFKVYYDKKEKVKKKESILSKIFGYLGVFLAIIVFMLNSGLFRYRTYTIASPSMRPALGIGDVIIVDTSYRNNIDSIKVGDILIHNKDKKIISHRVVTIDYDKDGTKYFITKGDNNSSNDSRKIYKSDVIGVTTAIIPFVGYLSIYLQGLTVDDE